MFKIDLSPRLKKAKDPANKRCEPFLSWLRKRNCLLAHTGNCEGRVRACHWDEAGDKGMASKVSDRWSLPMCDGHHAEQTDDLGWPKFQLKYRFNPREVCETFWNAWLRTENGVKWQRRQDA
jgi:hypothetical protein